MNKQIINLVLVVILGVGIGLLVVSRQEPKKTMDTSRSQEKALLVQSIQELRTSIQELTVEMKGLRALATGRQGGANAAAAQAAQATPPVEDYNTVYPIDIAHSPVIGKQDAPVTIVEFMDFQCPYCGRFHPALEEVLKQYPDQVRYVIKNYPLPFHAQAKPAAKAVFAAGEQGKYREMANLILENQKSLSDETFKNLAQQLGLDVEKFWKDYTEKDAQWEAYINKDIELGRAVGVRGTPSYYLNGKRTKARSIEEYKQEIDAILKK